jgi:hypothetical protein
MSVVRRVGTAASAEVLRGARPVRGRVFLRMKRASVVAVALLALAALISASDALNNAEHYSSSSAGSSSHDQSGAGAPVSQPAAPEMGEKEALDAYAKLPLSFIPNEGQTDEEVRYYAQGAGYGFFFTKGGATLSFAEGKGHGHALALDFLGANPHPTLEAQERLSGEVNYLLGDDPVNWQQGLPTHGELLYGGLWPGIDMAVRGEGGKLKYEFHVQPGSSVEDVRLAYRGAEGLSVGAGGELLVRTSLGVLKDAAPVSYQLIGGERVPVESRYRLLTGEGGGFGFAVGSYDPRYPLVIDPGLDYSTFLGGTDDDEGLDIAVGTRGRAYVTGLTFSADFPTTPGAFDTTFNDSQDAVVSKLNARGSALVYSTFLGGTGFDNGSSIGVLDRMAYVTGDTQSADFPTTPGAFDRTLDGSDAAFVTKLNARGSALVYSTFLSGFNQDFGRDIAVGTRGRAYVTGFTRSSDFPTTPGAFDTTFDGSEDAFVTKLNARGSALVYSTLLGGGRGDPDVTEEAGLGIAVLDRMAYVTGFTTAPTFPTTPGAFDTTLNSNQDAFVTKLNARGSALVYSTFLGGASGEDIAVDTRDRAYVTGSAGGDIPTTPGAFDRTQDGEDAFVTKLNRSGSALVYSTLLGGEDFDFGSGIAVVDRRAYVTGFTNSPNFPTTPGAFDRTFNGGASENFLPGDAFVTKLNARGSALAYSTFLGGGAGSDIGLGIAVDGRGMAYVTGFTTAPDFPTTRGAFDRTFSGGFRGTDAFVTKLPTG